MNDLKYIQPNHYNMQTTMSGKIVGMKIVGCNLIPQYNINKLFEASKEISKVKLMRTAMGTITRKLKARFDYCFYTFYICLELNFFE